MNSHDGKSTFGLPVGILGQVLKAPPIILPGTIEPAGDGNGNDSPGQKQTAGSALYNHDDNNTMRGTESDPLGLFTVPASSPTSANNNSNSSSSSSSNSRWGGGKVKAGSGLDDDDDKDMDGIKNDPGKPGVGLGLGLGLGLGQEASLASWVSSIQPSVAFKKQPAGKHANRGGNDKSKHKWVPEKEWNDGFHTIVRPAKQIYALKASGLSNTKVSSCFF